MEQISFPNQTDLGDLDPQKTETDQDLELAAIAAQLRETASYAINPTLREELRKELLQQFVEHRSPATKPIEDKDDLLSSQLSLLAADIAKLPVKERKALLSDLAERLPITAMRQSLEEALQKEGLQLHNADSQLYENAFEHKILLRRAYRQIIKLLEHFDG